VQRGAKKSQANDKQMKMQPRKIKWKREGGKSWGGGKDEKHRKKKTTWSKQASTRGQEKVINFEGPTPQGVRKRGGVKGGGGSERPGKGQKGTATPW